MAKPSGSMKTIRTTDGTDHEIIPDRLGNNGYVATPPTLSADSTLALSTDIKDATITITQGGTTKGSFTLNQSSNQTIALDAGGGGGGSVSIDNTSITENSSNQIQTVGVIDQKTGNANKQWTGTLAQYTALGTHDANTFYNITDDVGNEGNLVADITLTSNSSSVTISGLDLNADGGVYDFVVTWNTVTVTASYAYFTFNSVSSGYAYVQKYYPSYGGLSNTSASNFELGHSGSAESFSKGSIMLSSNTDSGVYYEAQNGSFGTAQYNMTYVGMNASVKNVTSITFTLAQSFKAGSKFRIYKRSTNNARITS